MADQKEAGIKGAVVRYSGGQGHIDFTLSDGAVVSTAVTVTEQAPEVEAIDLDDDAEFDTEKAALDAELGEQVEDDTLAKEQAAHEAADLEALEKASLEALPPEDFSKEIAEDEATLQRIEEAHLRMAAEVEFEREDKAPPSE